MFQSTLPTRGSDYYAYDFYSHFWAFQSTLPTRGSDTLCSASSKGTVGVSIHAPHEGERLPRRGSVVGAARCVSIHAPHEGERRIWPKMEKRARNGFNPRSPRGGATKSSIFLIASELVSIHAPHEGERRFESIL